MLDIGGWELLLIALVAIVVVGPKELPGMLRTVMAAVRRVRELAREFQSGLEEIGREVELDKLRSELDSVSVADDVRSIGRDIENSVNAPLALDEGQPPPRDPAVEAPAMPLPESATAPPEDGQDDGTAGAPRARVEH